LETELMKRRLFLLLLLFFPLLPGCDEPSEAGARLASVDAGRPDTDAWGRVLGRHARAGGVDYQALSKDRADLDRYLQSLRDVDPSGWSREERIAFWTNAYNAVVVHHVLARYPKIRSVKEEDGFFDEVTFPVAGRPRTLDEIEAQARELGDPRVHFAVVCASTSCPDLRADPYRAEALGRQLQEDTRRFLADPAKGLRYDPKGNKLHLSSIFKWYAGDFTGGSTVAAFFARGGILDWVIGHAPPELARTLKEKRPSVEYLDYDWSLNDR
jgi:hypothetical protein